MRPATGLSFHPLDGPVLLVQKKMSGSTTPATILYVETPANGSQT
jgi:hypothetical protein